MQPPQTREEEFWNAITHGIGLLLAIAMLVLIIVFADGAKKITAVSIYGTTMVLLYLASTLNHTFISKQKLLNKLDHSAIYLLIAGTYTPILLVAITGALGWTFFGIVWGIAILGIVYKAIYGDTHIRFSTALYIIMGWLALGFIVQLIRNVSVLSLIFLILGGLSYTVGTYFFMSRRKFMHIIWHLCVILGTILHFFVILWL